MNIEAKDLSKVYNSGENRIVALDHANLEIVSSDFISIMGPSGSGKSTLLHLLSGLDRPTSGSLTYDGKDIYSYSDKELSAFRRKRIGFIFQQFNLLPVLTAKENIIMPLLLDKKQPDEAYLKQLTELLGIQGRLDHLPHELSGGQQQRVAIARALIAKPDDEAAQVVRRIYSMTLEGYGTEQIATQLEKDEILTPRAYWLKKGIKRPGKGKQQPATKWNSSTVTKILSLQEYCGDILNFKTYSKSYKNKKRLENDRENWVIFKEVHEPIIERSVFEQVQQKRGKIRKRRTNEGEHNMFSGLLVCADCGCNLHFHFNQGNPEIKYFNCSNYKGNRGSCTSTHYVRVDFLEQVVLGEIRRLTKFASLYEDEFLKAVIGHSQQAAETDRKLKEKELKALIARDEELDGLFERIYEDNVSGKLSDDRFAKMSRRYEDEQKELAEKIKKLRSEIEKQSSQAMTTDMFISLVRKYTRARKLTPRMLNELVEKIEVYHAEKIDGVWEQRLRIHYNCVGEITIPKMLPLPIPDVTVNTRKGVFVNYAPCQIAI